MRSCILFDLDGTLLDTAPDLLAALNAVLASEGFAPRTHDEVLHTFSHGSQAMLEFAFGPEQEPETMQCRRNRFLAHYAAHISRHTRLFDTMPEVLATLEAAGMPWGIVTNKPAYLTTPLLEALALHQRAASVISGDTLEVAKPHPRPLLVAAQQCGVLPRQCVYVGDAERDIAAGRSAGMTALIAGWGYLPSGGEHQGWQADAVVAQPLDLLSWLDMDGHG